MIVDSFGRSLIGDRKRTALGAFVTAGEKLEITHLDFQINTFPTSSPGNRMRFDCNQPARLPFIASGSTAHIEFLCAGGYDATLTNTVFSAGLGRITGVLSESVISSIFFGSASAGSSPTQGQQLLDWISNFGYATWNDGVLREIQFRVRITWTDTDLTVRSATGSVKTYAKSSTSTTVLIRNRPF